MQNGKTLTTDGPFVGLKEAIGGYLLFDADDLDVVIEVAARIPAASLGGAIEIRPIAHWIDAVWTTSTGSSVTSGAGSLRR